MTAAVASRLWDRHALRRTVVLDTVGLVALTVALIGADGQHRLDHQVVWLDFAVLGSLLAALGQIGWLLTGRRAVSLLRRQVIGGLRPVGASAAPVATVPYVMTAGGQVHQGSCLLVRGKALQPVDGRIHPTGHRTCPVCGGPGR